jgi:hypothetical protein
MRWAGNVASMGEERIVYKVFDGKARRKETTWKMGGWNQNGS